MMKMLSPAALTAATLGGALAVTLAAPALAQSAGHQTIGISVASVRPKSDNGRLASTYNMRVGDSVRPSPRLNYHFETGSTFKPYVGLGLNDPLFWGEKTEGALAGTQLDLKQSLGLAVKAGADHSRNAKSAIRRTLRWIDIDSDTYLNSKNIGTVEVDPLVVQAAYAMKF